MLFFDWRKIHRASKGNAKKVVLIVRSMLYPPLNKYDATYPFYLRDFSGKSFLVNIEKVLEEDFFYRPKEIAEYVALASFRNYAYYATTGDTSLDLLHSPVRQDIITNNRLLSIENDRVRFKYEEVT
jgi:hypothetical protein